MSHPAIVIDPGHGGAQPAGRSTPLGGRGPRGISEKTVNLALAQRVVDLLGGAATLTRSGDQSLSLGARIDLARRQGARYFVSLHAHEEPAGVGIWHHAKANAGSRALASQLHRALNQPRLGGATVDAAALAVLDPEAHDPHTAAVLIEAPTLGTAGANLDPVAQAIAGGLSMVTSAPARRWGSGAEGRPCGVSEEEAAEFIRLYEAHFADPGRLGFGPNIAALTAAQQATATAVYGSSLDFSNIYLSDATGAGGRPFTVYVPIVGRIVLNCGTLSPGRDLLIHELCHAWQSQHHSTPSKFMWNSVGSQGEAIARNLAEGSTDPHRPFSSYAYLPGKPFGEYGAEQIANQVENGVSAIVSHVASVSAGAVDADNVTSLATLRVEDTRLPGVVP